MQKNPFLALFNVGIKVSGIKKAIFYVKLRKKWLFLCPIEGD